MMSVYLSIWGVLCIAFAYMGTGENRGSAGMPLAYFLGLSLIHTPGASVYVNFPRWVEAASWTEAGFAETIVGMVSFFVAVMVGRSQAFNSEPASKTPIVNVLETATLDRLSWIYIGVGISYFMVQSLVVIPSLGAAIATLISLLIVGACLRIWLAQREGNTVKYWLTVAALPLLPVVTLVQNGFMSFGTYWMLAAASFTFAQSKHRTFYLLLAPFLVYFALSIFMNWMAARTEFRQKSWHGNASLEQRIDNANLMFKNFEWFNSEKPEHREVVDSRLNQNIIVGAAVERLTAGAVPYSYGQTLEELLIGLIPRVIWPSKPAVGGKGGAIIEKYSGMAFDELTSVGAGQVLEFYITFGTAGVIAGFLIYGGVLGWLDAKIMMSLRSGDQRTFIMSFMICLAMLQPGNNLLEIVVSVAGSMVTAKIICMLLTTYLYKPQEQFAH
jgi:hypothetical protein